jgi:hypothetical protein
MKQKRHHHYLLDRKYLFLKEDEDDVGGGEMGDDGSGPKTHREKSLPRPLQKGKKVCW